jgi:Peptidase family M28/PDZ domain/PA domain
MESRLRKDLSYFADDAREGRGVATQGLFESGDFIANRFAELGLNTQVFGDSPFQEFGVPNGFEAAKNRDNQPAKNWVKFSGLESKPLEMGRDWNPLSVGSSGEFEGQLVFAGYGITAKDNNYDDYANVDVKGKVVIVLRKEPQGPNGSLFGGVTSQYAYFSTKELNAHRHGAAAMVVVNDSKSASQSNDKVLGTNEGGQALNASQVPTLCMTRSAIEPILLKALGKTLDQLESEIHQSKQPASQILPESKLSGATQIVASMATVRNVAAILPGTGSLAGEYVVVGAHYDHVGMGGEGSLAPGTIAVHNGADDNGSGTVSILEVARQLAANQAPERRSILFMAFAAEERGLLGSEHYVQHPAIPLEKTVAMVNLDMVGRLNDGAVTVFGMGTASEFSQWLDEANGITKLELSQENAGLGPSDHQSFYLQKIPVFHFFTGLHNQYHRPTDDLDLVDFSGLTKITQLVSSLTELLSTKPSKPTLQQTTEQARIGANPGRKRATLGVSFDATASNCRIVGVLEGSRAELAGIKVGDIITKVNERAINRGPELSSVIRGLKIGDEIVLNILRGEQSIEIKVKL